MKVLLEGKQEQNYILVSKYWFYKFLHFVIGIDLTMKTTYFVQTEKALNNKQSVL